MPCLLPGSELLTGLSLNCAVILSDDERDFLYLTQLKATRSKLCQAKATWLSQQQQGSNATLDNIAYLGADVPGFKPGLLNGFNNRYAILQPRLAAPARSALLLSGMSMRLRRHTACGHRSAHPSLRFAA